MKQNDKLSGKQGALFVQPDGPNGDVHYLGCFDASDLVQPRGEVGRTYHRDPNSNGWAVTGRRRTAPSDPVTISLTGIAQQTRHWLESRDCPIIVYVHQVTCEKLSSFTNYVRGAVLQWSMVGQQTEANLVQRQTNDEGTVAFEMEADFVRRYYRPTVNAQITAETQPFRDIAFVDLPHCVGPCGGTVSVGNLRGAIVCASDVIGITSNVHHTEDGGVTWAAWANDPFPVPVAPLVDEGDGILSVVGIKLDTGTYRWIVTRDNESVNGNALDIAYSDDLVNWTLVIVGAATDIATGPGALFALDAQHIWMCWTNAAGAIGYISVSYDGGLTWTAQEDAGADALNCIRFIDRRHGICVGDQEVILLTEDGGATWAAPAGLPGKAAVDLLSCDILDANRMWVAFEDGDLYYTEDGGANWSEREFTMPIGIATTAYQINDLKFVDDYCGYFVFQFQKTGPVTATTLYRTVNGGRLWEEFQPDETLFAWQAVAPIDYNTAGMVGDVSGGLATVHKLSL